MTDPGYSLDDSCKYVLILWCDGGGVRRARVVPAQRFTDVVAREGLSVTTVVMGCGMHLDGALETSPITTTGSVVLKPDLTTLTPSALASDVHLVLGSFVLPRTNSAWEYCPRGLLGRQVSALRERYGYNVKVGFETEFTLFVGTTMDTYKSNVAYCQSSAFCERVSGAGSTAFDLLRDIHTHLEKQGVVVEQLHPEGAGQFEIVSKYEDVQVACDNLLVTRETIAAVAAAHGMRASFAPKCGSAMPGTGCHAHISVHDVAGRNVFGGDTDTGMSGSGEKFLGGVLRHLSALMAVCAPSLNSYDRLQPKSWSGCWGVWGEENKEAALRTCRSTVACNESYPVTNFELKPLDALANPHIALGCVIAAGMDGLDSDSDLPRGAVVDPGALSDGDRERLGYVRLPQTPTEAVRSFDDDDVLVSALGPALWSALRTARLAEEKFFSEMSVDERGKWVAERY